jgi:hypothetical protein
MLNNMPTRPGEIILANMKQSMSLTLRIFMSLYPRANLDTLGEDLKLVEYSAVMVRHIIDMLKIDISLV